jgi:glycogen operon protein
MRNLMATLLLSQGVTMICGGDEVARTQLGNNNAYCQDNELSWTPWTWAPEQEDFLAFVRHLVALRRSEPVLHRRRFFQGRAIHGIDVTDIGWYRPSGRAMDEVAWNTASVKAIGVYLSGSEIAEVDEDGERIAGDTLYIALNAHHEKTRFQDERDSGEVERRRALPQADSADQHPRDRQEREQDGEPPNRNPTHRELIDSVADRVREDADGETQHEQRRARPDLEAAGGADRSRDESTDRESQTEAGHAAINLRHTRTDHDVTGPER